MSGIGTLQVLTVTLVSFGIRWIVISLLLYPRRVQRPTKCEAKSSAHYRCCVSGCSDLAHSKSARSCGEEMVTLENGGMRGNSQIFDDARCASQNAHALRGCVILCLLISLSQRVRRILLVARCADPGDHYAGGLRLRRCGNECCTYRRTDDGLWHFSSMMECWVLDPAFGYT